MPDLARQGPFSYDVLSRTGNGEYTLDKSDFNADNGEILEVIVNGVKIEGDGSVANATDAEAGGIKFDFLSNGFKCRDAATGLNASGVTYVYMAFAEHPFVGDGTNPVTAR